MDLDRLDAIEAEIKTLLVEACGIGGFSYTMVTLIPPGDVIAHFTGISPDRIGGHCNHFTDSAIAIASAKELVGM